MAKGVFHPEMHEGRAKLAHERGGWCTQAELPHAAYKAAAALNGGPQAEGGVKLDFKHVEVVGEE